MSGFLPPSLLVGARPQPLTPRCGDCGLYKTCKSPKMKVAGRGRRRVLVVGEAPGPGDDAAGRPFDPDGAAGAFLRRHLEGLLGLDLDEDCWATNALICRPPGGKAPTDAQVRSCRPALVRAASELKPEVILAFGEAAVRSLVGWVWRSSAGEVSTARWAGWRIPCQRINTWLCPTYHPAACVGAEADDNPIPTLLFKRHLRPVKALLGSRPWEKVPDYAALVRRVYDPDEAASLVDSFAAGKRQVAFDYENDRLKPDHPDARVVCCALSDGRRTVAYPWAGAAVRATREFLAGPVPKIASNLKHEERWTIRVFGAPVRNWHADTTLDAHVLANRRGTAGLKFQAFVRLGADCYNAKVEPFMGAEGGNAQNKIKSVDLGQLLLYCGTDALLEWQVSEHQAKEFDELEARG